MFLFVCDCEWCELWYPKLRAHWLDNSLTLANHSKTLRHVALLHENPSFKAVLQSRNVLSKNSKFLYWNPELRISDAIWRGCLLVTKNDINSNILAGRLKGISNFKHFSSYRIFFLINYFYCNHFIKIDNFPKISPKQTEDMPT